MECHSLKLCRYYYHDQLGHDKVLKLERRLAESHSQRIYYYYYVTEKRSLAGTHSRQSYYFYLFFGQEGPLGCLY